MVSGKKPKLYAATDWRRPIAQLPSHRLGVEKYRDEARRDYARVIHSPAFRRLQGKTQLFPSSEGDFFRNRLTHSLEVAQIAKSIAIRANGTEEYFKKNPIDTDLVELAGLAHDIGHPPFGHNGEAALDRLMLDAGGFEGNAQTLRILTKIEKKATENFPNYSAIPLQVDPMTGRDLRLGLNLSARSLASILKYDKSIPLTRQGRDLDGSEKKPCKGYYSVDKGVVDFIKDALRAPSGIPFRTIECSIMDIADDIAYSTYDIEDSFKAAFISPARMIAMDDDFKGRVVNKVKSGISEKYKDINDGRESFGIADFDVILGNLFQQLLEPDAASMERLVSGVTAEEATFILGAPFIDGSFRLCRNGYLRTSFTSELVGRFIRGVEFEVNEMDPAFSKARLTIETFKTVECLKHFSYELLIESPMLKLAERRGSEIIEKIFSTFKSDSALLPDDWRNLFKAVDDNNWQSRVVCDYIAGMTDRYCVEIYARLTSENPISIWKPH